MICLTFVFVLSLLTVKIDLDNRALKTTVISQQKKINTLQDQSKNLHLENEILFEKNQKLTQENKDLINAFNQKNLELNEAAKSGTDVPSRGGISPRFILSNRGSVDRSRQDDILNKLTEGLYQYQKVIIPFDVDNLKSWSDLGNWKVSCYTATTSECDSDPSTTSSGQLSTPSFTVAVDPNFWKPGTVFYFQNLGFGIAADSGGSVKGKNRADFMVASKAFAYANSGYRKAYLVHVPD